MTISNFFGLICAFGSTLIFVSQNIFFKRIMPTNSDTTGLGAKLDKINLLYFSSSMAFILMIPVWIYSDVPRLLVSQTAGPSVTLYFFINGTVHFAQNLLAFAILSSTSPVTYSIASLVKRIAVICLAIIWFKQTVHPIQAVGIGLTGVGLWMYNNAKRDVEKGEKKMRHAEAAREGLLPTIKTEARTFEAKIHGSPRPVYQDFSKSSQSSALRGPEQHTNSYLSPMSPNSSSFTGESKSAPPRHRRLSEGRDETMRFSSSALRFQTIQDSPEDITT
jgi:solute carrier family 35 protein E1